MFIREIISLFLILTGVLLIFVAAIGILRLPDLFLRMSASTKASTLGTVLVLLGVVFHFWESGISARLFLVLFFIFGTAPVSAHMLGRAAYSDGVPLWSGTQFDELRDKFEDNIPTD